MAKDKNRIEIPCEGGVKLVVEQNSDPNYERELFIFVEDDNGCCVQDLVIARQAYQYSGDYRKIKWKDSFNVLVFGNENDGDYTEEYNIRRYIPNE